MSAVGRDWVTVAVGPRRVGGRYRSGYWDQEYEVLAVRRHRDDWMGWSVTERDVPSGRVRTHCTPWDYDRDVVLAQPALAHEPDLS